MPDHVHMLLNFPDTPSFSPIVGDWKRWLTKHCGLQWQENFFEHRLRNEESSANKAQYIMHNPVRAGLVERAEDWPYLWLPDQR
jgi:putative transposase